MAGYDAGVGVCKCALLTVASHRLCTCSRDPCRAGSHLQPASWHMATRRAFDPRAHMLYMTLVPLQVWQALHTCQMTRHPGACPLGSTPPQHLLPLTLHCSQGWQSLQTCQLAAPWPAALWQPTCCPTAASSAACCCAWTPCASWRQLPSRKLQAATSAPLLHGRLHTVWMGLIVFDVSCAAT